MAAIERSNAASSVDKKASVRLATYGLGIALEARPARPSDRCGGRGSQAHCALLAFVDEGRGVLVGAPSAGRQQDPRDAISSQTSATERYLTWTSLRLQHQVAARPRDVDCGPGGAERRTNCVAMETAATKSRRAGASALFTPMHAPLLAPDLIRFSA